MEDLKVVYKSFGCVVSVCADGYYGDNCEEECQCGSAGHCNPFTGQCSCDLGWQGSTCEELCPAGRFGPDCIHTCQCDHGAGCDPMSGCCQCTPGYYGQMCEHGM